MPKNMPYATAIICIGILSYWLLVSLHSGQALFQSQHSRLLLLYGALDGPTLEQGAYWRLIASQFSHVRFPHMLGNVLLIFLLGSHFERQFGRIFLISVYFLGGLAGTYASVVFNPALVTSGASQALCSLAGFLLIHLKTVWRSSRLTGWVVILVLLIQCGLDLYFAGRLKEGHVFGFLAGSAMGFIMLWSALAAKTPLGARRSRL